MGLFFLLVIVDGALRKWVLPSQEQLLFLLKDVVLWGGYIGYAFKRDPLGLPRPLYRTWVPVLFGLYIALVLLQAFNPRQPNVFISFLGLKTHLAYLPVVVLLPAIFVQVTDRQVIRFLWGYALLICVPIIVLSIYQYTQPRTAWINRYVNPEAIVAKVGDAPRVTGPFPYIGSFAPYLQFNAVLGASIALAGMKWARRNLKILGGIIFGGTAIVLPMTGSRSPVVLIAGGMAVLFLAMRAKGYWIRFFAIVLVGFFVASGVSGDSILFQGWEALAERTQTADPAAERISSRLMGPIQGIDEGGLLGYGVGSNHQVASQFVSSRTGVVQGGDNKIFRVFVELGALGWLVLEALKVALLYVSAQAVRRSRSAVEFIISATALCVLVGNLLIPVVYNVVMGALYWGSAGAMLGVWSLQKARR
ncbi:O-antigen ligase family protein [Salinibacter ruber]|uniref:O-antigen ligase family protein n=1 Tax=Salinibacter ruber TaxID=146919 RepID=UPI0021696A6C|nr:hypothetical protein [Salinibacter ruber]